MRQNFSTKIKQAIALRVNYRCSNPLCGAQTSGPQMKPDGHLSIGVAAHICAASPGGARYEPKMTEAERISPENGIWLCQNCAKIVDNDRAFFTTSMLHTWKKLSEEFATKRIGIRMPFDRTQSPEIHVYMESGIIEQRSTKISRVGADALAQELLALLPNEEGISDVVILNRGHGLHGQSYATLGIGTQYGWKWKVCFFVAAEFGWEISAQLDFDHQKGNRPEVIYVPGSPGALVVTHLAGYGTGIWHQTTSWYRISRNHPASILSYPSKFYVFGWHLPFDRELSSAALSMPALLSNGELLHLMFNVNYSIAERYLNRGESSSLLKDSAELRLVWNADAQAFIPLSGEDNVSRVADFWGMDVDDFIVKYRVELERLAQMGSSVQKSFIAAHLFAHDTR